MSLFGNSWASSQSTYAAFAFNFNRITVPRNCFSIMHRLKTERREGEGCKSDENVRVLTLVTVQCTRISDSNPFGNTQDGALLATADCECEAVDAAPG